MKQVKMMMLLLTLLYFQNSYAQTKIGDLYYELSGTTASVAESPFEYNNQEYIIPDTVEYNNMSFVVNSLSPSAFRSSTASKIIMPNTISTINMWAFRDCPNLYSLIIPPSVTMIGSPGASGNDYYSVFSGSDLLRELIYLPRTAPILWEAINNTYVPDKQSYSSPVYTRNGAHIIEMITFEKTEFEYTGQAPSTTWTNNVEGYTASISMLSLNGDVGNHEEWIPVTFTKGSETFTAEVVYRYIIKPAKLRVKVSNVSREYGEENPQFSISYSGFVTGDNESVLTTQPTISTTATKKSNVGDYPITVSGGVAANYEFVYEPGVLTVNKAPLSAKVNDATKVYGSQNPAFTIEYYGLKNGETAPAWTTSPTFQTEATKRSNVGNYEVTAINGVPVNYDCGDITAGTLTITPAPLTIKANDATMQYYSDEPNLGYTCNGFVNGENENVLSPMPTLATTANKYSSVGTYPIKVSGASNSNYSISYIDGTLTITPRTLYASVGNYERLYNENNPVFVVKYDGFVGNEDENVLGSKAIASTTATKTSDVGSYPINVTGGSADNYKFSYRSGTLTINKAEQTISWEQDLSNLKVGDQVELQAIASSGLSITYTMDSNGLAEIYSAGNGKMYLDCKAEGIFTIRASQDGNKNYYSSTRINKTVSIGKTISYEFDAEGIHYLIGENNTVSVTPGDVKYTGDITIPQQVDYDGSLYYVTGIEPSAFSDCNGLTSITIPKSVISIGRYAFSGCSDLTSVNIPDGVTSIEGVFEGCSSLTDITIPNSVITIGEYTFSGCSSLTSITIPNSVSTIGMSAFQNCRNIISVLIGNSVTSIGNYAFDGCASLTSVILPNSVNSLGSYVFRDCSSLSTATISDNVTSIEYRTFSGCNSLTSVNIPKGVANIGGYAFSECSSLPTITIPNSVTSIGQRAFSGCIGLVSIVSEITFPFAINENVFESASMKIYTDAILVVPEGTIDNYKETEGWREFMIIEEGNSSLSIDAPIISKGNGIKAIYSIRGEKREHLFKGMNIIRMDDGTIKKVVLSK